MTDTKAELMPCPFCGGKADYFANGSVSHPDIIVHRIACHGVECETQPWTGWRASEEEVIAAWNHRALSCAAETGTQRDVVIDAVRVAIDGGVRHSRSCMNESLAKDGPCTCGLHALAKAVAPGASSQSTPIPVDVRRLVIAARNIAFNDTLDGGALRELDEASEAFADRVPWEDEPEGASLKSTTPGGT